MECRQLLTNVGGGYLNHGLDGIYYSDSNFTNPAFTRKDVRLEFDWGAYATPGGSISAGYSDVGSDHYSIRWTGQLMPRFTETYTFTGNADETILLELKPADSSVWTTVVHQTAVQTSFSGSLPMQAGQPYDVRVSYTEQSGAAAMKLRWSSRSTPIETIDTITRSGINNPSGAVFTDILKGARNRFEGIGDQAVPVDAQGWPTTSEPVYYYFQESLNQGLDVDPLMLGRAQFQFRGRADISVQGNVDQQTLSYNYNAVTNLTSGSFVVVEGHQSNASAIWLRNSTRNGQPDGPGGFTDLQMLRPVAPNSSASYGADTVFTAHIKDAMAHFEVIRHQLVANQQKEWSDRTLPGFFNQAGGTTTQPFYTYPWAAASNNGWSWEYKVLLANETGRDLMISIPPIASGRTAADTSSYLVKLANLLRYGSDGVEPYTSAQQNPLYPPLNSNLRAYLEIGNELWNDAGVFGNDFQNINMLTLDAIAANNADFQAINFDNLSLSQDANGNYVNLNEWRYRMIMLRTVQISNIFRSVFGDAAMPMTSPEPRIRPLYEWQYGNFNNTAQKALTWADRYFNKTDPASTYTGTAQPVRYFLYGGGGAAYYGAVNGNGLTDLLPNSGFDLTGTPGGYTENPAGTSWVFSGSAGIARDTGPSDDIPAPFDGQQMGYLSDTGSMTSTFVVPETQTSNIYGVSFKAHNRMQTGAGAADMQNLRVYLDYGTANQQDITARTFSQGNGYTPPAISQITAWNARNVFWTESQYYYTKSFSLEAGSTHTITIVGQGDINNPQNLNQTAFLEDVRITSVDAIFAGGMPGGGEATGQPVGSNINATMQASNNWAKAFGLEHVAYESGWSLGGDDHGSAVQLKAKYGDPRTAVAQQQFMEFYDQAGGDVNVFGTYAQWPDWSDSYAEQALLDVSKYPIINGIDNQARQLKAEATSGITVPAVIDRTGIKIVYQASATTGTVNGTGGWMTWNIIVPNTGRYVFTVQSTGGGAFALLANDAQIALGGSAGALTGTVQLVRGLTVLKVRSMSGAMAITNIAVAAENSPQSPIIDTFSEDNGTVSLSWSAVTGATGYIVRYGSSPADLNGRIDAGGSLSQTVSGLPSGTTVFFAVSAYNSQGESLPSATRSVIVLENGTVGDLAQWEFTGLVANGDVAPETAAPRITAGQAEVSALSRGAGLVAASGWVTQYFPDRFSSTRANSVAYGATVAEAIARDQFTQFTVSPRAGRMLTITELRFQAWFNTTSGVSAALQYSVDGTTFTTVAATGVPNAESGYTVNLESVAELKNVETTLTFRIVLAGIGSYDAYAIGLGTGTQDLVLRGSSDAAVAPQWLTVTIDQSSISESAGAGAATGTVTRNSTDLSSPLTVTLSSNNTAAATVPTTVVIPSGASSTTFAIAAVDDVVVDGSETATITATASAHSSGTASITVTDNDSPVGDALTLGITRRDSNSKNNGSYRFDVNFTGAVSNIDASDFVVVTTGSVTADSTVTVADAGDSDPTTWLITATDVAGAGVLGLALSGSTDIVGPDNGPVTSTPTVSETYHVVRDAFGLLSHSRRVFGNVTASVSGTTLLLVSDPADNALSVSADAAGNVVIAGLDGTTINGQSQLVAFAAAGGVLPGDLRFTGSTGVEFLSVAGVTVTGGLITSMADGVGATSLVSLDVGGQLNLRGNDAGLIYADSASVGGNALFFGGVGDDQIELNNLQVTGVLSATTGDGADTVLLNRVNVVNSTQINTGSGDDILQLIDTTHENSLYAATELGDDQMRSSGITVKDTLYMLAGDGDDVVDFYNMTTQSTAVISTDAGDDVIRLLFSRVESHAYLRVPEGNNVLDLQDSFFGANIEGQTTNGTLTTRLRRNIFTGTAQLVGGLGSNDVLLDDGTSVFHSVRNAARYEDLSNTLLNEPFSRLTEYTLGTAVIDDRHGLGSRTGRTAGDVMAVWQGPDLVLISDAGDNAFSVFANQTGDIVIRGRNGTTINGVTEFVALTGVAGVLPDDLKIIGSAGDDLVEVSGVTVTNDLYISTGDGVDGVLVSYAITGRDLQVRTDNDEGYIDLEHSILSRHTIVSGGTANDLVVVTAMDIRDVFSISTGDGADHIVMNHTMTDSGTSVTTGLGDDDVSLLSSIHNGTLYITSDGGDNVLTGRDVYVAQTFYVALGVNNSSVQLLQSQFDSTSIIRFSGGQNLVDVQDSQLGGPTYLQATGGVLAARIRNNTFGGVTTLQGGPGSTPADILMNDGSNSFQTPASITGFEDLSNALIDELFGNLLGLAFA